MSTKLIVGLVPVTVIFPEPTVPDTVKLPENVALPLELINNLLTPPVSR